MCSYTSHTGIAIELSYMEQFELLLMFHFTVIILIGSALNQIINKMHRLFFMQYHALVR